MIQTIGTGVMYVCYLVGAGTAIVGIFYLNTTTTRMIAQAYGAAPPIMSIGYEWVWMFWSVKAIIGQWYIFLPGIALVVVCFLIAHVLNQGGLTMSKKWLWLTIGAVAVAFLIVGVLVGYNAPQTHEPRTRSPVRAETGTGAPLVLEPDPIIGSWEAYARSKSVGGPKVGLNEGEWASQDASLRWTATFSADRSCEMSIFFDQRIDPAREYGAIGTFTWEKRGASYILLGQSGEGREAGSIRLPAGEAGAICLHDGDLYLTAGDTWLCFRAAHDVDKW